MGTKKEYLFIIISYIIALFVGYISFVYLLNHMNLLFATLLADVICTLIIFIFSMIINNSSVYDPYWSVIPIFIVFLWMIELNNLSIYSFTILAAFLIWGIRLTLNWAMNWKGFKHEDWRYVKFRKQFGSFYWVISLLGVHLFPTLIVYLAMMPILKGLEANSQNIIPLIMGFLICLLGAFISNLSDVHLTSHRKSNHRKEAITSGIWKYTRHPNYLGELTFWFGCFVLGGTFNYTIIGFVAMVCLFEFFSIPVMEKRLLKSKANYQEIINSTPRLIPIRWWFHKMQGRENEYS